MNCGTRLFALLTVLVVFETSCQKGKDQDQETDYRTAFCGTFNFTIVEKSWFISQYTIDTSRYTGEISIFPKTDSMLLIRYFSGPNHDFCNGDSIWGAWIKPTLYPDGSLKYPPAFCATLLPFTGKFISLDSVRFSWWRGLNGSNKEDIITGVRK